MISPTEFRDVFPSVANRNGTMLPVSGLMPNTMAALPGGKTMAAAFMASRTGILCRAHTHDVQITPLGTCSVVPQQT